MGTRSSDGKAMTAQPAVSRAITRSARARRVTATRTGNSRAVRTSWLESGKRAWLSSTILVATRGPAGRAVSMGSSAITVPMPTTIASIRPRSWWTRVREPGDEIHWLLPEPAAVFPSSVIAHLART